MFKKETKKGGEESSLNVFSYIVFHPKYLIILIFIVSVFTAIALNIALSYSSKPLPTCGDGTFYESCSLRKPYFCDAEKGSLIEKASLCGCSEDFERVGDSCVSIHHINPKEVTLNYLLNGERGEINFVAYEGAFNYVSNISRIITYKNQKPLRSDFKVRSINEKIQREFLIPLIVAIQNKARNEDDQLRIAVSVVQNIPYNFSEKKISISDLETNYSRYPYEIIYEHAGICGEKSTLLAFLLKEMGYDVVIFYNKEENHEAVGVKCPLEHSYKNTGYCFIETSGPSIISDDSIEYSNGVRLLSDPEVIHISYGKSIGKGWPEYKDAEFMRRFRNGEFMLFKNSKFNSIKDKYGLIEEYFVY